MLIQDFKLQIYDGKLWSWRDSFLEKILILVLYGCQILKTLSMLHSQHQITIDYYIQYRDHILYIMKLLYYKYNIPMSQNTVYLEI